MKKRIELNRLEKEAKAKEFCSSSVAKAWPPQEEVMLYVTNKMYDLVEEEIKDILGPILKTMDTSVSSPGIIGLISGIIEEKNNTPDEFRSSLEYYNNVSDLVFSTLEEQLPELLGQEDSCMWFANGQ